MGVFYPIIFLCLLAVGADFTIRQDTHSPSRVYTHGRQFPLGSENLRLPKILAISLFLGAVNYPSISLTLESMKLNPDVTFVLINVVEDSNPHTGESSALIRLKKRKNVDNFEIKVLTFTEFSLRVQKHINISVEFNRSWFYKMTDYKPTVALLFPELFETHPVKFWGYVDLDVIWGSFSKFAHLFQGDYSVITSDFQGVSGVAMFFKNEEWTKRIFLEDSLYPLLLKNITNYQLDEFSRGEYDSSTMDSILERLLPARGKGEQSNKGRHVYDKLWIDSAGAIGWAGPVRWWRGSLQVVRAVPEFPAGHEFLIFHRPNKDYDLHSRLARRVALDIEEDMVQYGYLLPNFVPLLTRYICPAGKNSAADWQSQQSAMDNYSPYSPECFGKPTIRPPDHVPH